MILLPFLGKHEHLKKKLKGAFKASPSFLPIVIRTRDGTYSAHEQSPTQNKNQPNPKLARAI
jgi:hypothetical protein